MMEDVRRKRSIYVEERGEQVPLKEFGLAAAAVDKKDAPHSKERMI